MANKMFKLFANCILVKGYSESVILDLQECNIFHIPNGIIPYIEVIKGNKHSLNNLCKEDNDNIDAFIEYFIEKGLGHYCNENNKFPPLNTNYYSIPIIKEAVFHLDGNNISEFLNWIEEIAKHGLKAVKLYIEDCVKLKDILPFLGR